MHVPTQFRELPWHQEGIQYTVAVRHPTLLYGFKNTWHDLALQNYGLSSLFLTLQNTFYQMALISKLCTKIPLTDEF